MLTLFLALVEKLTALIRERSASRRQWFTDVVNPLFTRFEPVARDYLTFFDECSRFLAEADPGKDARQVVADLLPALRKRREETLQARRVVELLAQEAQGRAPADIADFCFAVQHFFYSTGFPVLGSHSATFLDILDAIAKGSIPSTGEWWRAFGHYGRSTPLNAKNLAELTRGASVSLSDAWTDVSRKYAALQASLP